MGNKKAREFFCRQSEEAAWHRVHNEPRLAADDVRARGIAPRRLQLLFLPSFEEPLAYELRQAGDEWSLSRSRVVDASWRAPRLLGYEPIPFDSAALADWFARITAQSLPIAPAFCARAGLDGEIFQLALFGDLYSECRFQWWSDPPSQWQPLVTIANEMLQAFAKCES